MSSFITSITKGRKKTPEQLVRLAARDLQDLAEEQTVSELKNGVTPQEDLCKRLSQIKVILYGDGDKAEVDEEKAIEVSKRIQEEGLMLQLIDKMDVIPFEARKDTAQIFNNLMHKNIDGFVSYVNEHFACVLKIAEGYANPDIALNSGSMLRECIRYEQLTRMFLHSEQLWLFFDSFVHLPNFDVASDAFNTLRDILASPRNKQIASEFLEEKYEEVFEKYEMLLKSSNYVTRRRSLKLLGEILLDRSNFNIMMRYISSERNLQQVMNLLRDKSPNIQFEAFHVFKVFVANPKKPALIRNILFKNQQKLCEFLTNFHQDKEEEDSQFSDEKKLIIDTLSALEIPSPEELHREKMAAREAREQRLREQRMREEAEASVAQGVSDMKVASSEQSGGLPQEDAPLAQTQVQQPGTSDEGAA
mmetsp:Transcript_9706/g.14630  ORF Transcript_9706/g.14630 Transcript_9706/m.14630 type:complete len:419 (+) Transcript_9706:219-1475(+)|eukprot:CAMPEP_0185026524 /NCGR_PEP_ID=MMETSP1103-20130426/10846_1 /TAXON_ID=36769 /ORGANISM="Paraphysomonas bandaiensis, Strain Caron Lab Isolate" /LENGTH=418 /DNA_ID=CAMNT_0027560141 /DNA_START=151 /DNA_END=1407 /DNA_ORIENTATION=-